MDFNNCNYNAIKNVEIVLKNLIDQVYALEHKKEQTCINNVYSLINYTYTFSPTSVGLIRYNNVNITNSSVGNRIWNFTFGGYIKVPIFSTVYEFDPTCSVPNNVDNYTLNQIDFLSLNGSGQKEPLQGFLIINNENLPLSDSFSDPYSSANPLATFDWNQQDAIFTLKIDLTNVLNRIKFNSSEINTIFTNFWIQDAGSIYIPITYNSNLTYNANSTTFSACCYYRYVPTTYISSTSYQYLNVFFTYSNLTFPSGWSSTLSKNILQSYIDYSTDNTNYTEYTDNQITFYQGLMNTATPSNESNNGTKIYMPFSKQYGVYCLPLCQFPSGFTSFRIGLKFTTGSTGTSTIYYVSSASNTFGSLNVHIFETVSNYQGYTLPTCTISKVTYPSNTSYSVYTSSVTPPTLSLANIVTLNLMCNYTYAYYYNSKNSTSSIISTYTSTQSTFSNQNPTTFNSSTLLTTSPYAPLCYASINIAGGYTYPGYWFNAAPTDGTPTSYSNGNYLAFNSKLQNYSVPGLINQGTDSTLTLTATTKNSKIINIKVVTGLYPTNPTGFAYTGSSGSYYNFAASYCDPEPNTFKSNSCTFNFPVNSTSNSPYNVTLAGIGYSVANHLILTPIDAQGNNPYPKECLDIFGGHINEGGNYHSHASPPHMFDFYPSVTPYLLGWALDGYPIVSPFLVRTTTPTLQASISSTNYYYPNVSQTVAGTTYYWRYITSSDLTNNHGLVGSFTITIPSTAPSTLGLSANSTIGPYNFMYVSTFDYPFDVGAFYGDSSVVTANTTSNPL